MRKFCVIKIDSSKKYQKEKLNDLQIILPIESKKMIQKNPLKK